MSSAVCVGMRSCVWVRMCCWTFLVFCIDDVWKYLPVFVCVCVCARACVVFSVLRFEGCLSPPSFFPSFPGAALECFSIVLTRWSICVCVSLPSFAYVPVSPGVPVSLSVAVCF